MVQNELLLYRHNIITGTLWYEMFLLYRHDIITGTLWYEMSFFCIVIILSPVHCDTKCAFVVSSLYYHRYTVVRNVLLLYRRNIITGTLWYKMSFCCIGVILSPVHCGTK